MKQKAEKFLWYLAFPLLVLIIISVVVSIRYSYDAGFWVSFLGTLAVFIVNGILIKINKR